VDRGLVFVNYVGQAELAVANVGHLIHQYVGRHSAGVELLSDMSVWVSSKTVQAAHD